mgnify:FL=1
MSEENLPAQELTESSPPSQERYWLPRILVLAGAILFGMVGLEVLLQLFYSPPANIRFKQDVKVLNEMGMSQSAAVLENDDELFWRLKPSLNMPKGEGAFYGLISNSQGYREDHEIPTVKPAGQTRVLFLGDSCTFGYGVDYKDAFVERSEVELRKQFPALDLECINAGIPAYTLFQGWRLLETEGFDLDPDVIVMCFGGAEPTHWDNMSDLDHYEHWLVSRPSGWLQWSRICQITSRAMAPLPRIRKKTWNRTGMTPRLAPYEFQLLLNSVCEQSLTRRIPVIFLVWPFRVQVDGTEPGYTKWQEVALSMMQRTDITIVDLSAYFREAIKDQDPDDLFIDSGHTTAEGHAVVARGVVEVLGRQLRNKD